MRRRFCVFGVASAFRGQLSPCLMPELKPLPTWNTSGAGLERGSQPVGARFFSGRCVRGLCYPGTVQIRESPRTQLSWLPVLSGVWHSVTLDPLRLARLSTSYLTYAARHPCSPPPLQPTTAERQHEATVF